METIKEVIQKSSLREWYEYVQQMRKSGAPLFENRGLGAMTQYERNRLLEDKKILEKDGNDFVATKDMGIIRFGDKMDKNQEHCTLKTFYGTPDRIRFQIEDIKQYIQKAGQKVFEAYNGEFPNWDGQLPI